MRKRRRDHASPDDAATSTAGVGGRAGERTEEEQDARVEDVGEVDDRADERADDESGLHGHREPRRARVGDMRNSSTSTGVTAVAENHSVMPRNSATASAASIRQASDRRGLPARFTIGSDRSQSQFRLH